MAEETVLKPGEAKPETAAEALAKAVEALDQIIAKPAAAPAHTEEQLAKSKEAEKKKKEKEEKEKGEYDEKEEAEETMKSVERLNIIESLTKSMDDTTLLNANSIVEQAFDMLKSAEALNYSMGLDNQAKIEAVASVVAEIGKTVSVLAKAFMDAKPAVSADPAKPGASRVAGAPLAKALESGDGKSEPTKEQFMKAVHDKIVTADQYSMYKKGSKTAVSEAVLKQVASL